MTGDQHVIHTRRDLFPKEDLPMNPEELEKFKTLLAAYEQALRLQRRP